MWGWRGELSSHISRTSRFVHLPIHNSYLLRVKLNFRLFWKIIIKMLSVEANGNLISIISSRMCSAVKGTQTSHDSCKQSKAVSSKNIMKSIDDLLRKHSHRSTPIAFCYVRLEAPLCNQEHQDSWYQPLPYLMFSGHEHTFGSPTTQGRQKWSHHGILSSTRPKLSMANESWR